MNFQFVQATKEQSKARIALMGPSGSGKTYTALEFARHMGQKVAVIDTENGSASKYADQFDFMTLNLSQHSPENYVKAILAAEQAGFDVLIIDSLSHAWAGRGGALEMVDNAAKRSQSGNSYTAWREVTPHHNRLVDALVSCKCHLVVTMRSKTEYVLEQNARGKSVPRKVGLAPIQRDGLEYEFDVVAEMDYEHNLIVSKTRCSAIDGEIAHKPGAPFINTIMGWLNAGTAKVTMPHFVVNDAPEIDGAQADEPIETIDTKSSTYKELHYIGSELYGPDWDDKRHELVKAITGGRTESSRDITEYQAGKLVNGMRNKLNSAQAMAEA